MPLLSVAWQRRNEPSATRMSGRGEAASYATAARTRPRPRTLFIAAFVTALTCLENSIILAETAKDSKTSERLAELIVRLSDDRFTVRESAMRELIDADQEAVPLLRRTAAQPGDREARQRANFALRLILAKRNPTVIAQLSGHNAFVNLAAFSPDGETLVSVGEDGKVIMWRWRNHNSTRTIQAHASGVLFAAFSPDGRSLVTAGRDSKVKIWNAASGELQATVDDHQGAVSAAIFSPDGGTLITAGDDGAVKVRDASGKLRFVLAGHRRPIIALAISPDGKTLISGGGDWNRPQSFGEVQAWDLSTQQRLWSAQGSFGGVWGLSFSSDGRRIAGACLDRSVRLWDVQSGREQVRLQGHADRVIWTAFRPGSSLLVSTSYDGTIRLWDTQENVETAAIAAHAGPVQRLGFAPGGKVFATTGNDRTIRIWEFPN